MRPLRIVGPSDSGKTTLIERLVPKLAEGGRVGTVKHLDCRVDIDEPGKDTFRHRAAGAAETYGVMPAGSWFATGRDRRLGELLVTLAADYDYVLIEGYSSEERIPAVVLGNRDHAGTAIATASGAESVGIDTLIERLEQRPGIETLDSLVSAIRESIDAQPATAIGTCIATQSPTDPEARLEDRQRAGLGSALDACRPAIDSDESLAAVETHDRPKLAGESGHVGFVALAADTRADAHDAITECGHRISEAAPVASVELATTWTA